MAHAARPGDRNAGAARPRDIRRRIQPHTTSTGDPTMTRTTPSPRPLSPRDLALAAGGGSGLVVPVKIKHGD